MIPTRKECLEGFENIPRRWNKALDSYVATVVPGEFYVTKNQEAIQTTLGSCIACCIRDTRHGIGGLNHFMLPENDSYTQTGATGDWAMEFLINGILLNGGERRYLEVKCFGGAQMLRGMSNSAIGKNNIEFIESYLKREDLFIKSKDVGGTPPRKIVYFPKTGKVKVKKLPIDSSKVIEKSEKLYSGKLVTHDSHSGEIDLF